jgi:maltose O-acetyltransferase
VTWCVWRASACLLGVEKVEDAESAQCPNDVFSMLSFLLAKRRERYIKRLRSRGMQLGRNVVLNDGFFLDPSHCHLIEIEDDVVFGPNVSIFAHDASSIKVLGKTRVQRVIIRRNAFVGASSVILPGAEIGASSIIGAGSVVTHTVPGNEVWAGNPARFVMTCEDYRKKLDLSLPEFQTTLYASENITPERRKEMAKKLTQVPYGYMVSPAA